MTLGPGASTAFQAAPPAGLKQECVTPFPRPSPPARKGELLHDSSSRRPGAWRVTLSPQQTATDPTAPPGAQIPAAGEKAPAGAACSHVSPQPGHSGPAHGSATWQLSARPGEPAALDAGPHCRGCVPGPCRDCLCCQPLLVPGRARAREHGHDHGKQSRRDPGRN